MFRSSAVSLGNNPEALDDGGWWAADTLGKWRRRFSTPSSMRRWTAVGCSDVAGSHAQTRPRAVFFASSVVRSVPFRSVTITQAPIVGPRRPCTVNRDRDRPSVYCVPTVRPVRIDETCLPFAYRLCR